MKHVNNDHRRELYVKQLQGVRVKLFTGTSKNPSSFFAAKVIEHLKCSDEVKSLIKMEKSND